MIRDIILFGACRIRGAGSTPPIENGGRAVGESGGRDMASVGDDDYAAVKSGGGKLASKRCKTGLRP